MRHVMVKRPDISLIVMMHASVTSLVELKLTQNDLECLDVHVTSR